MIFQCEHCGHRVVIFLPKEMLNVQPDVLLEIEALHEGCDSESHTVRMERIA